MLLAVAGAKGGVGASVVAAALALEIAREADAVLIDFAGDQPDLLGVGAPGAGIRDWLAAEPEVDFEALDRLTVEVTDRLQLVPTGRRGESGPVAATRVAELAVALGDPAVVAIADLGVATEDAAAPTNQLVASADRRILVVRACYLALRRVQSLAVTASDVVEVREGGRALSTLDIESVVGQPVSARVPVDPAIARVVDAGLLVRRTPRPLRRMARDLMSDWGEGNGEWSLS